MQELTEIATIKNSIVQMNLDAEVNSVGRRNLMSDIKQAIQVDVTTEEDYFGDAQLVEYDWDLVDYSKD